MAQKEKNFHFSEEGFLIDSWANILILPMASAVVLGKYVSLSASEPSPIKHR